MSDTRKPAMLRAIILGIGILVLSVAYTARTEETITPANILVEQNIGIDMTTVSTLNAQIPIKVMAPDSTIHYTMKTFRPGDMYIPNSLKPGNNSPNR